MYNSNNIANMIKHRAKEMNISIKQLLIDVDLGKNTLSNFKTSMPKADNLAKIADYLECSVDYLLGRTDIPEVNRGVVKEDYDFASHTPYIAASDGDMEYKGKKLSPEDIRKINKSEDLA